MTAGKLRVSTRQYREWCPRCGEGFFHFEDLEAHARVVHDVAMGRYFGVRGER